MLKIKRGGFTNICSVVQRKSLVAFLFSATLGMGSNVNV